MKSLALILFVFVAVVLTDVNAKNAKSCSEQICEIRKNKIEQAKSQLANSQAPDFAKSILDRYPTDTDECKKAMDEMVDQKKCKKLLAKLLAEVNGSNKIPQSTSFLIAITAIILAF